MARDISEWLESLGLGKYADAITENEIDFDALPHVTEEDLKEIGIALGARLEATARPEGAKVWVKTRHLRFVDPPKAA